MRMDRVMPTFGIRPSLIAALTLLGLTATSLTVSVCLPGILVSSIAVLAFLSGL
jgi:hypothetical protein